MSTGTYKKGMTCSSRCRAAAICVARLKHAHDFYAIGCAARVDGHRSAGRRFGISHVSAGRIAKWDGAFAAKVTKYAKGRFG